MFRKIFNQIKKAHKIIIFGHIRPDGDCYGSQFGLKNIIKTTFPDKEVYVVGGKCEYCSFLGKMDELADEDFKDFLGIVVDTSNLDRISDQRYQKADFLIKIDHHMDVEKYGNISYVVEESPACAAIITDFLRSIKDLRMTQEGAFALYTGILTDTGRFKYGTLDQHFFNLVGLLASYGLDLSHLDELLSVETLAEVRLKGYVLSNIKSTENGVIYFVMTKNIMEEFQVSLENASSLVNLIGNIENSPVYFFAVEYDTEIRLRIRSRGPRIDLLASKYEGGGHMKASGAMIKDLSLLPNFLADIDQIALDYKSAKE